MLQKLSESDLLNRLIIRSMLSYCCISLAIAPTLAQTKLPSPTGAKLVSPLIKTPSPTNQIKLERVNGEPVITIDRPAVKPTVNIDSDKKSGSSRELINKPVPTRTESDSEGDETAKPKPKPEAKPETENLDDKLENREASEQSDLLKGDLPCLDSKPECVKQLEQLAIANSPDLKALDIQIASSSDAVKLAKVQGQGSFIESITPWVSAIAPILLQNSKPQALGEIRTGLDSRLLFEALPIIISGRASSDANQTRNSQANADLQIKLAQLEKTKAEITIAIRGKVVDAVITFEGLRDESDLQSTIVRREEVRSKLIEISYRMGESSTIEQVARMNEFDRKKIIAAQIKSKLRSQALKIQRLVKGNEA